MESLPHELQEKIYEKKTKLELKDVIHELKYRKDRPKIQQYWIYYSGLNANETCLHTIPEFINIVTSDNTYNCSKKTINRVVAEWGGILLIEPKDFSYEVESLPPPDSYSFGLLWENPGLS